MDARFHVAGAHGGHGGMGGDSAGDTSAAGFGAAALQDVTSAPLPADPMDLDFDFDTFWAGDLDHLMTPLEPDLSLNYAPPTTGPPTDFLFAEDEGVLPTASRYDGLPSQSVGHLPSTGQPASSSVRGLFSSARSDRTADDEKHSDDGAQDHGLAHQRLRRQLSLLSKGWAGDEIRFKNCDASKAVVLHSMAMELGLGYGHDVGSREVSVCRPQRGPSPSRPQLAPGSLSSSLPRSSTELDSTLCLPDLPVVPEISLHQVGAPASQEPNLQVARLAPPGFPNAATEDQGLARRPSRSERLFSTIKTSIGKGGRRGPLSEMGRRDMRALETAGGACWRCKVLRRKCDLGTPCRSCLQSVPTPHLGDDAPPWHSIGCRRGPLRDSVPAQLLCPGSSQPRCPSGGRAFIPQRGHSVDAADRCLLAAESQRLADMKAVLEGNSYKLSITDPALNGSFSSFIENARYRDRDSLQRSYPSAGGSVTYTELIAIIAWELAENQALLPLLEIRSWDGFMGMLETACVYESEIGQTSLVIMSMLCLRHCLEALRLHSAGYLSPDAHEDCGSGPCRVECIRNLGVQVAGYIDELSSVIFNKENMRDRRWWLSTFYSLYIQSYVRHALIAIERQLRFRSGDDVPAEDLTATQYMHLPAMLFTAASTKYDPLLDGRLHYALTDNSVIPETSVPELHHSSARAAFEVDKWAEAGIRTPYQFLRRLLQIGSLDFSDSESPASGMMSGLRPSTALDTSSFTPSLVGSPVSPRTGDDGGSFFPGPGKRDSYNSQYSAAQVSTMFSNQSSDSLARTLSTDMTSLYESSLFARMSFSDSMVNLSPTAPTALFASGHHNGSLLSLDQALDQALAEGAGAAVAGVKSEGRGVAGGVEVAALVCSCCPRTPRQFHTSEELALHEAEKPHPCTQCKKRFKSPTEAERHINAIHLKADFWSCQALAEDMLRAYSRAETCGGDGDGEGTIWDLCGFCGGGIARGADGVADTEKLVDHVQSVHRVGECDRNKQFYRADNFRQHLKNTHVAAPGKWLKALESACRRTREAPVEG